MPDARNKYTTLISNTIIFALGTFGSKLEEVLHSAQEAYLSPFIPRCSPQRNTAPWMWW